MKTKIISLTIAVIMAGALLPGCDADTKDYAGSTVYGEITEINGSEITVALGEISIGEAKDAATSDGVSISGDEIEGYEAGNDVEVYGDADGEVITYGDADGEVIAYDDSNSEELNIVGFGMSSMLTLTGEELTVTVGDNVTISNYGFGGAGSGEAPELGDVPQGNSGEAFDMRGAGGDEAPDISEGEIFGEGEIPDENGDASDVSAPGNIGSGGAPAMPEGAEGEAPGTGDIPQGNSDEDSGMRDSGDVAGGGDMPSNPAGDDGTVEITEDRNFTIEDLSEGDIISMTFDDDGNLSEIGIMMGEFEYSLDGGTPDGAGFGENAGASGDPGAGENEAGAGVAADISYTALSEFTEDTEINGETFDSTGKDENAILVSEGAEVSLSDITVTRESSDSTGGDNSSFYGVGAAILTTNGTTYIKDSEINTAADGAAGVFSYGEGITYVEDTTINTAKDTSGGIHVAGGGTLYATNLEVTTAGESSAAIRSDRGSGTMVVNGGTYTSNGTGSPAIYSTAEITVNDAILTANESEAVCIEGLNSVYLSDCDLSGNMADNSQNDCTWNVILYQSMSGDSEEGNSTFKMSEGSITAKNGGMFYTTNTESTFILEDVDITYASDGEFFLRCTGNNNARGWGSIGSNGADCAFTAINQDMEGDIIWDSISTLDFYITEGSTLKGAVIDDETYAGSGGSGECSLYMDSDSSWIVTADSELTNLYNAGIIRDADGNTVTIVGTDGTTYVNGSGAYIITVESYSTSADTTDAGAIANGSNF